MSFDDDIRDALRHAAATIDEPADLAERTITAARTAPPPVPRRALRRGLTPLLAAAAVVIAVLATVGIVHVVDESDGHSSVPPANPSTSAVRPSTPPSSPSPTASPSRAAPSSRDRAPGGGIGDQRSATRTTERSSSSTTGAQDVLPCTTSRLRLTVAWTDGAAGTLTVAYRLHNTGARTCSLYGYPGYSVLDRYGQILDRPATRTLPPGPATIDIRPGGSAQFEVKAVDPDIPGSCPKGNFAPAEVQVYPPNQTAYIRIPSSASPCRLQVSAVHAPESHESYTP